MIKKYFFYNAVENFISEKELTANSYEVMILLQRVCQQKYPYLLTENTDSEFINEIFTLYIIPKANKLGFSTVDELTVCFFEFQKFLKEKYNIVFSSTEISYQLRRVLSVYKEFSTFLETPVLSFSPLIIDIKKYRKAKKRKAMSHENQLENGYFEIVDMLSTNYVLIRNIHSGKFLKLLLSRVLFCHMQQKDILHMIIRQRPYMGWEVEKVKAYYPPNALQYIVK